MAQTKIQLKSTAKELEKNVAKCLQWFFAFPQTRIGLTDLAASTGFSKTSAKQAVEYLVSIGFLNKEAIGKAWLLSANQQHPFFVSRKIPHNLSVVYESGILDAIHKIIPSARAIILFGSYRWGTDTELSDIDIAVEIVDNKELEILRLGVIEKLGYRKKVAVNLHVFSHNKIDLNLFSNIANGIVLDGFLEVRA